MKRLFPFLLILSAACNQSGNDTNTAHDTTTLISYDTIPEIRKSVKQNAVAEYSEPISDQLNDWKFAVSIYETERTFHFTVRIQAKEVRVSDSLNIPNFGIQPRPDIKKGKEPLTCIIGFYDTKNVFREYRKVSFKDDRLHISTLNTYSVGAYRTKIK